MHLQEDNTVEALRQYRTYERLLRDELSLRPSVGLRAMLTAFLRPATTA